MECDVLDVANRIVENMITMIKTLQKERTVVTVENPRCSVLWYYPELIEMVEDRQYIDAKKSHHFEHGSVIFG